MIDWQLDQYPTWTTLTNTHVSSAWHVCTTCGGVVLPTEWSKHVSWHQSISSWVHSREDLVTELEARVSTLEEHLSDFLPA